MDATLLRAEWLGSETPASCPFQGRAAVIQDTPRHPEVTVRHVQFAPRQARHHAQSM